MYLVVVVLVWELDVDVVFRADVGYFGPLTANDLGVILRIHSDGQLEAPEGLQMSDEHKTSPVRTMSLVRLVLQPVLGAERQMA